MSKILPPDPIYCFKANMGHIHSMCFISNSHYTTTLLAATEEGMVYFWDVECSRLKFKQLFGRSILTILAFEDQIITQEKEGLIKLWELKKKSYGVTQTYSCFPGFCKIVQFQDKLLIPKENYVIEVVTIKDFEVIRKFQATASTYGQMMCLQMIQVNGRLCVLAGFESGDLILFDYDEECQKGHLKLGNGITSVTFDCYTMRGVVSNRSDSLEVFGVDNNYKMEIKAVLAMQNEGHNVVKIRCDGKVLVAGGYYKQVKILSWQTLRILCILTEHKASITDIAFSDKTVNIWENKVMATSDSDGMIAIWSLYN